ncbi:MAG: AAA family ATPase, partial [Acidimicrobiia bacterium]|nr:AAA family ATPase [Acidimicrobiia bacterium]
MSEAVAINVVFTDLVGSTEMSSRLGPEATEALRLVHFGLLRGAMVAHGGSEVKNLGDGLMIVFPGLTSALNGSVAMQQAIERHNASGKEPLGIRVGLSTGDATEDDGDYFGEPVVEAARLCAKCEAGQIITTELVSMMARKSDHTFESIGELELRGVPEPVPAVTLQWEPMQVEGAVVMPARITPDMDLALAGRVVETAALAEAFTAAEAGDSRITFLAGEPGIGKTRLAAELATHAHGRSAVVLYGRADEELTVPYQPWVEAMTHLLEHAPADLVAEAVRLHGPELATLVPGLRRRNPELATPHSTDPETERYLLLQAVTATIAMLAVDAPVLVVLDDLHWADKPTLTMLRHLFTNVDATKVMIVCTYRDSDLETGHPLIDTVAALRREPGVELLSVGGLDDLEMIALVEASAGHELDDRATEMAVLLRRESAGNPFFAHEILRNLVESGDLVLGDDGRWVVEKDFDELAVPQSVRDVVGQRIARLGEETLKTLSAAAVIGRDFELALLAEVTGDDEDDLLDLVEAAAKAGILVEVSGGEERFRFQHTLARQTLEAGLSEGRRRRMHRKVAEAIEATCGDDPGDRVGELATHWFAATVSVDGDKVTHYARLAGRRAETGLAPDEAVRWFTMALENLDLAERPDDQVRAELLVDLGTSQKHTGNPEYRTTLLDASALAERLGDTALMVAAALANNRGFTSKIGAQYDERIAA